MYLQKYNDYLKKQNKKTIVGVSLSVFFLSLFLTLAITLPFRDSVLSNRYQKAQSDAAGLMTFTGVEIPLSDPEIINPMHGYFKWNSQEVIQREVLPSLDSSKRWSWSETDPLKGGLESDTVPGEYTFDKLEAEIAAAASQGRKYYFGVRMVDTGTNDINVPKYIETHGDGWRTNTYFVPDWNSQYFQSRVAALLSALGQRYNNDPRVGGFEIRTYGKWGEWHMSGVDYANSPIKGATYCAQSICQSDYRLVKPEYNTLTSPTAVQQKEKYAAEQTLPKFIDQAVNAFGNKRIIMLRGGKGQSNVVTYAMNYKTMGVYKDKLQLPMAWRADCLGLIDGDSSSAIAYYEHFRQSADFPQWTAGTTPMRDRWKTAPVVAEYCQLKHGMTLTSDLYNIHDISPIGTPVFQVAQKQVRDFHVGMVGNGNFVDPWTAFDSQEQADAIKVGKLAGYRFILRQLSLPATIAPGSSFSVTSQWANVGAAPAYEPWDVMVELRNPSTHQLLQSFKSRVNLQSVEAAQNGIPVASYPMYNTTPTPTPAPVAIVDNFTLPATLPVGNYEVTLRVLDSTRANQASLDPLKRLIRKPMQLAIRGRNAETDSTKDTFGNYVLGQIVVATETLPTSGQPTPTPSPITSLQNPGFESGMANWGGYGEATVVQANSHAGSYAARVGRLSSESGLEQAIQVTAGKLYTLSGWGKMSAAGDYAAIGIKFIDSAGNEVAGGRSMTYTNTLYEQKNMSVIAPASSVKAIVYVYKELGNSNYFYADDLSLISIMPTPTVPVVTATPVPMKGTFTGITSGQTVSGNISVCYSSQLALTSVDFIIDNDIYTHHEGVAPYCLAGDTSGVTTPYDTKQLANGTHTISVTVTRSDLSTYTDGVTFTVNNILPTNTPVPPTATRIPSDTTPPSVSVTYPLNNAIVVRNSSVTLTASASDNVGIARVEFYVNGSMIGTPEKIVPYTMAWSIPGKPNATYTITAKAYDSANNQTTSQSVRVTAK